MANVPIMLGGGASADLDQITATASDILASKKSVNSEGDVITGTIPSLAARTWNPGTSAQTIQAGQYLSGTQTISAISNTNLSAGNIKKGVTITIKGGNNNIYSVTGTWEGYIVGAADFYNRGSWGASAHNLLAGSAGTSVITCTSTSSSGGYRIDLAIGPKSAYGYTKIILTGSGLSLGTSSCRYKVGSLPTSWDDGTVAEASHTASSTQVVYNLTTQAINAGNVYWMIRTAGDNASSYVNRIYFA